jgi:hypothetical protein
MLETVPGSGHYILTLTSTDIALWPDDVEQLRITLLWYCDGVPYTRPVGRIVLIDPSGQITDEITGDPVPAATVTLYRVPGWRPRTSPDDTAYNTCESHDSKGVDEAWSQAAPTSLGVIANPDLGAINGTPEISPTVNPQIGSAMGRYGWDVVEGCWYVVVQAAGYETKVSPVVGVPPEVTDLDLALTPVLSKIYLPLILRNQP